MTNKFIDDEANEILVKFNRPYYSKDGGLWLYWLFKIEAEPGGFWTTIYLENSSLDKHRYSSNGYISDSIKEAWKTLATLNGGEEQFEKNFQEGKRWTDRFYKNWEKRKQKSSQKFG